MNKTNNILSALLIAQLVLAGLTWATCQSKPSESSTIAVFDFKASQVTALEVTPKPKDKEKTAETVKLAKKKDQWVITTADDFPADNEKVLK